MNGELRAGALSAMLVGSDLADIRWGSLHVARCIQVTVRDPSWGTVAPVVRSSTVEHTAEGFRVELDAIHDDGAVAFGWHGSIRGRADGSLVFAIEGVAERDFVYRRIGICVLHPWRTYVGAAFRASDGSTSAEGTFPLAIVPQLLRDGRYHAMVDAFTSLDVRFPDGVGARFAFEGERFELEDHRNWTDASFKTYPTPLALSEPRPIRAGERISQHLVVRVEGRATAVIDEDDVVAVRVGEPTDRRMPPIGLVAPGDPSLRPAHLRVDVNAAACDGVGLAASASAGIPLEVALLVDEVATGIETIVPLLEDLPLARFLVHLESGATIPGSLVNYVRSRLGAVAERVPIVGGTWSHFSELNRLPPDEVGVDAIGFGVSPTVHTTDERSMMETLEIQREVALRASVLANDLPIIVSSVSLDPIADAAFADAWTVGSVSNLATAGVSSITYERSTPALAEAIALAGSELRAATVSRPDVVAALAAGDVLLVANLTPITQQLQVDGRDRPSLSPYEVRAVD